MMVYGLVDCNNFFVSCERVFRPALEGRPAGVLSSNDGCIVARSDESQGVWRPDGTASVQAQQQPRPLIAQHDIAVISGHCPTSIKIPGREF